MGQARGLTPTCLRGLDWFHCGGYSRPFGEGVGMESARILPEDSQLQLQLFNCFYTLLLVTTIN